MSGTELGRAVSHAKSADTDVRIKLGELTSEIEEVNKVLARLRDRLKPLLSDEVKAEVGSKTDNATPRYSKCPLSGEINRTNDTGNINRSPNRLPAIELRDIRSNKK